MKKSGTLRNRLFDIGWVIFLLTQLMTLTAWYALDDSSFKVTAYKVVTLLTCAIFAAVIVINIIKRAYPVKTFICYVLFGLVCLASWYFNGSTLLIVTFLILMAAYELDGRRVILMSCVITGVFLFFTAAFSEIGITENYLFDVEFERPRYGLGFSWATIGPTLLFFFSLQYIYLRKEYFRIWEAVIIEAVNVYMYLRTDTNLPFLLLSAFLVFFVVQGLFKNHWRALRHLKWLYYVLPVLICGLTVALYILINYRSEGWINLWYEINDVLNNRLIYGRKAVMDYGWTLFGQQIEWVGSTITGQTGVYNYVDCSYIRILLDQGIVFLIAVLAVYTRMMVRAVKAGDFWLVFIVIIVLIHSFTEPRLMDLTFNVIPLLAFLGLKGGAVRYSRNSLRAVFRETDD